jgi:hypothetical protein
MLTEADLVEATQLCAQLDRGSISPVDWSNLAALVLIAQPASVLIAIAAEGFDRFMVVAEPVYRDHAFTYADYRRMFERVCTAAGRSHGETVS